MPPWTSIASNFAPAGPRRTNVFSTDAISVARRSLIHTNGGISSEALCQTSDRNHDPPDPPESGTCSRLARHPDTACCSRHSHRQVRRSHSAAARRPGSERIAASGLQDRRQVVAWQRFILNCCGNNHGSTRHGLGQEQSFHGSSGPFRFVDRKSEGCSQVPRIHGRPVGQFGVARQAGAVSSV